MAGGSGARRYAEALFDFAARENAIPAYRESLENLASAFMLILLERDRLEIVPDIARAFGELVDRREGIVKAKITTSVELQQSQRDALVGRLEDRKSTRL